LGVVGCACDYNDHKDKRCDSDLKGFLWLSVVKKNQNIDYQSFKTQVQGTLR
jgi:hypothetical protein